MTTLMELIAVYDSADAARSLALFLMNRFTLSFAACRSGAMWTEND